MQGGERRRSTEATPPSYGIDFVDRTALTSGAPSPAAATSILRQVERGVADSRASLPFLAQIQRSFGDFDVRDVDAGVGGGAGDVGRALGIHAYACGESVGFVRDPSLHTAAHEAAHVIQQRGGVSVPHGVGVAGDHHERLANQVADHVVRGESAEHLLQHATGGAGRRPRGGDVAPVVQFEVSEQFREAAPSVPLTGKRTLGEIMALTGANDRSAEYELGNLLYENLEIFAPAINAVTAWMLSFLDEYLEDFRGAPVEKGEPAVAAIVQHRKDLAAAYMGGNLPRLMDRHYDFADKIYSRLKVGRRVLAESEAGTQDPWDPETIRKRVPEFEARSRIKDPEPFSARGGDIWQILAGQPVLTKDKKPVFETVQRDGKAVQRPAIDPKQPANIFGERSAIYGMSIAAGVSGTSSLYAAVAHNAGLSLEGMWAYAMATAAGLLKFYHHSFAEAFYVWWRNGVVPFQFGAYLLPFAVPYETARVVRTLPAFRAWMNTYEAKLGPRSFSPESAKLLVP